MPIPPNSPPAIGAAIRRLREDRGWSQEHLAHAADVPVGTVGRIERQATDPRYSTLHRLASGLGLKVADLDAAATGDGQPAGAGQ